MHALFGQMALVQALHGLVPADVAACDGDSEDGGWGSDTDLASESGSRASEESCDFLANGVEFVANFVCEAGGAPSQPPISPRMQNIYETLGMDPVVCVSSVSEAAQMAQDALGPSTEDIRQWAFQELTAVRGKLTTAAIATSTAFCSSECAGRAGGASCSSGCTTFCNSDGCTTLACSSGGLVHPGSVRSITSTISDASCSSIGPGLTLLLQETVAAEDRETIRAAQTLVDLTPPELLVGGPSPVPHMQRVRNRVDHLAGCGIGSIRRATSTMRAWKAFCTLHSITNWGADCDIDMVQWFAREGQPRGKSVPHDRMEGMRWLTDNLGCPFSAAKDPRARKSAPPSVSKEPAWSEMLEVGAFVHLLRIALAYQGPGGEFVRPWAAAGFSTAAASLRMVDGSRSPPPTVCTVGGDNCLESTAALSKGRTRACMQPLPWLFPTTSPISEFTDAEVTDGLAAAFASLPATAPSMFMGLRLHGKDASLPAATHKPVEWGDRSSPARIITGISFLLQWALLSLTAIEARSIASKKHALRHVIPELSRIMGVSSAARDETGYWKDKRGRLNQKSNRYSRSAERILQCAIRKCVLRWVRERFTPGTRPRLEHFAANKREMVEVESESSTWIQTANETS